MVSYLCPIHASYVRPRSIHAIRDVSCAVHRSIEPVDHGGLPYALDRLKSLRKTWRWNLRQPSTSSTLAKRRISVQHVPKKWFCNHLLLAVDFNILQQSIASSGSVSVDSLREFSAFRKSDLCKPGACVHHDEYEHDRSQILKQTFLFKHLRK